MVIFIEFFNINTLLKVFICHPVNVFSFPTSLALFVSLRQKYCYGLFEGFSQFLLEIPLNIFTFLDVFFQ